MPPTAMHLVWVLVAGLLLAGALLASIRATRTGQARLRHVSRLLALVAILLDLGLVILRSVQANTWPIANNFDSVVLFVAMLGGLMFYLLVISRGRTGAAGRGQRGITDLILLPLMLLFQVFATAVYFGFRQFTFGDVWHFLHLASLIMGTLLFAAAAVCGVMYMLGDRALRRKRTDGVLTGLPSLERLERLIQHTVLLGFPLLTFGIVVGGLMAFEGRGRGVNWLAWPNVLKIVVGMAAWAVFAVVLHVRFVPRFRGRSAAWFSVAGFVLLAATYLIVQALPKGH